MKEVNNFILLYIIFTLLSYVNIIMSISLYCILAYFKNCFWNTGIIHVAWVDDHVANQKLGLNLGVDWFEYLIIANWHQWEKWIHEHKDR